MQLGGLGLRGRDVQDLRHQQLLLRGLPGQQLLHVLVHDALVRGVHVHQDHAVRGLRQNIDAVQLRDRKPSGGSCSSRASRGAASRL